MRHLDPRERVKGFDEVAVGYSPEEAMREAGRCLQCKRPSCVEGCPAGNDIPGFIARIKEGDFRGAIRTLKRTTVLPAVCGRVCPHEVQCQGHCVLAKKFEPVQIGALERFVADWEYEEGVELPEVGAPTGFKVAVVGSGPAGIGCAAFLRRLGHEVVMFEALPEAGGVLLYGIPEFRLPHRIVRTEIENLRELGVEILTN
ncbi:MAG: NAD(P)-binding protein, partial [Caldiserica bacterium]|nr:NAD(P)-binding protein [Caldisericota bacterium]